MAFLAGRTGLADEAGAAAVAAELGYLPLALAQAAAVITGQPLGYAAYLAAAGGAGRGDPDPAGGLGAQSPRPARAGGAAVPGGRDGGRSARHVYAADRDPGVLSAAGSAGTYCMLPGRRAPCRRGTTDGRAPGRRGAGSAD